MHVLYRLKGSKLISENEIESTIMSIDNDIFYNRVDIEKLSEKCGFSVFDRCEFEPYIIHNYKTKNSDLDLKLVISRKNFK